MQTGIVFDCKNNTSFWKSLFISKSPSQVDILKKVSFQNKCLFNQSCMIRFKFTFIIASIIPAIYDKVPTVIQAEYFLLWHTRQDCQLVCQYYLIKEVLVCVVVN